MFYLTSHSTHFIYGYMATYIWYRTTYSIVLLNIVLYVVQCRADRKEGNVLFNDVLNTLYLRLYGVGHIVKDHSDSDTGYPLLSHHMGYSFRLAARVLLYASSYRQDKTYHGLCYTSRGSLAGTKNSSMGPP